MFRAGRATAILLGLAGPLAAPQPVWADLISARLHTPTERYEARNADRRPDWAALELVDDQGLVLTIHLAADEVFEDYEARLWDVDGDGDREAVVVVSHASKGARIAVYDAEGLVAQSAAAGRPGLWRAPVGAGDLDGDGQVELAYVDRPMGLRALVFVRLDGTRLVETGRVKGVTNLPRGARGLAGGLRDCGAAAGGPEVVLFDAEARRIVAVRPGDAAPRDLGRASWAALAAALDCQPLPDQ